MTGWRHPLPEPERPMLQLGLDGRETPYPPPAATPLTPRQREILMAVRERGLVRTVEIGTLLHAGREHPCPPPREGTLGCCKFAAPDGWRAADALRARGLLEHASYGRWRAVPGADESNWRAPSRPPPDLVVEMVRLYQGGMTCSQVAERFYWSAGAVRLALLREGVKLRPGGKVRPLTADTADDAVELYGRGYSLSAVAEMLGMSYDAVRTRVIRFSHDGVRSRSAAQRNRWARYGRARATHTPGGVS